MPSDIQKLEEIRKDQIVRLFDVFILGPGMIAGSKEVKNDALKLLLFFGGVGAIFYNGRNYIEIEKTKRSLKNAQSDLLSKRL